MAMVPRSLQSQVDVGAAPAGRFEAPEAVNYGAQLATQTGQGLSQTAAQISRMASEMAQQANAARFDDAANKAANAALDLRYGKDIGYTNLSGEAALKRPDGKPLADEYTDKLNEQLIAISDSLGNDDQKAMFARFSKDLTLRFRGEALHYEAQQNKTHQESVATATQDTAIREISLNFGDYKTVDSAVGRIRAAAEMQAQLTGKSTEWASAHALDLTSKGHALAIGAALDRGDAAGADAYLKRYSDQMSADTILRARESITKQDSAIVVNGAVDKTYTRFAPEFAGSDSNRALNIMWGSESNNRQYDKTGNVIASGKGARGISQVMPDTAPEAAKLAGLAWNPELFYRKMTGDPVKDQEAIDYNRALGKAYFTKQLQDFKGDVGQTFAAYNAGPRWVKEAVERSKKATPGTQEADWFWQLNNDKRSAASHEETKNYVINNLRAYNSGKGRGMPSQKAVDDSVLTDLGPNATEAQKQAALQQSRQRYAALVASQKEQGYQVANNAISTLAQNGGDYAALPASVRDNLPFDLVDQVKGYAERVASGQVRSNPKVYDKLTDSAFLAKLSDGEFGMMRADLESKDFQQFAKERAALKAGKALNAAGDIPRESINASLANKLVSMGINPSPGKNDEKEQMRIGAIKSYVSNSVLETQAGLGRKMNDQEVDRHISGLFLRSFQFRNTVLGKEYGDVKKMPYLSMGYSDIPNAERDQIEQALKLRGVQNPSQGDVLGVYLNMKMSKSDG